MHIQLPEQREPLLRHVELIADAGLRNTEAQRDRADIEEKRDIAMQGRLFADAYSSRSMRGP